MFQGEEGQSTHGPKSGRGRALEEQEVGQGGGIPGKRGENADYELLQGISTPGN